MTSPNRAHPTMAYPNLDPRYPAAAEAFREKVQAFLAEQLPEPWHTVSLFNPMVYMVEGLRYGMLGSSVFSPLLGVGLLAAVAMVATLLAYTLLARGYKLKQ